MHWVIGDIHGMLRPLRVLLDVLDRRDPTATLVFAGDYVNRGPESRGVVRLLLSLDRAHFCRGNHDDVMTLLLTGGMWVPEPPDPDPARTLGLFLDEGLDATLRSYGMAQDEVRDGAADPEALVRRLRELVPEPHAAFFEALVPAYEADDFFVAHAYWPPAEPAEDLVGRLIAEPRLKRQLVWERFATSDLTADKAWGKTGHFGHTPVRAYPAAIHQNRGLPLVGEQIVLLDTGCCLPDGRLTAVCPETGDVVQVHRTGELLDPAA